MGAEMSHWWRAHDNSLDNPKLQRLPGELFKAWFNLCCITSQNGGTLPPIADIAFRLRCSEARAAAIVEKLRAAKLIDDDPVPTMHDWNTHQYKSDVSTERVQRFRERQRNVSSAVSETPSDQSQIRTDTEVGNFQQGGRRKANGWSPPRHGAQSSKYKTVYILKTSEEWPLFAEEHRKVHGVDPVADEHGGMWFPICGATTIPPPQRIQRAARG